MINKIRKPLTRLTKKKKEDLKSDMKGEMLQLIQQKYKVSWYYYEQLHINKFDRSG